MMAPSPGASADGQGSLAPFFVTCLRVQVLTRPGCLGVLRSTVRGGGEGEGTQVRGKKKTKQKNKHARREIQHASEQKNLDMSACEERLPRAPGSV